VTTTSCKDRLRTADWIATTDEGMVMATSTRSPDHESIELRLADDRDHLALRRVAERDTRAIPPGPHLVAVRDGRLDAALSIASGAVVADPFVRTADLVELLRFRAKGMTAAPGEWPRPSQRRRLHARPLTA